MSNLPRRQTLKLGAAAVVIGPSVFFAGSADAGHGKRGYTAGLSAGNFAVKIEGVYDAVPGVVSVDLGSVALDGVKGSPRYGKLTLGLAGDADAQKLTLNFVDDTKLRTADKLKISVSLFANRGKTPAVIYHATNAVPQSLVTDKFGQRLLNFTIGAMETVTKKVDVSSSKALIALPGARFKVEIEGIAIASAQRMAKNFYDWKLKAPSQVGYDPNSTEVTPMKWEKNAVKIDSQALKVGDQVHFDVFVTTDKTLSSVMISRSANPGEALGRFKIQARGGGETAHDISFQKAQLTSIEFPKLAVGSDALVTETFHFSVESGTG